MNAYNSSKASQRWNQKYLTDDRFQDVPARKLIRENSHLLPPSGLALEIAGGMGSTTGYLQRMGLDVVEVDISFEALSKAIRNNPYSGYILADACHMPLKPMKFDVICNFYFLERSVFDYIKQALAPGGLVFIETMTIDMVAVRPEIHPDRLLQHNEIDRVFSGWEKIISFEGWTESDHGKRKAISQLIARKPICSV
jgi:2-polyprenyl-3-methyl-5-hydroxy-6-metoxy-1,4-benzoquinol methylase